MSETDNETLTMDSLFGMAVDNAKADEATAKMLDKAGTYRTEKTTVTPRKNDGGRLVISVFGVGTNPKTGEKAKISVSLSPEYVEKTNKAGQLEPDYMTKRYVEARNAYKAVFGESPANVGQVAEYLRDYPVAFRIVQVGVPTEANPEPQGEPGTLVVNISAVKQS